MNEFETLSRIVATDDIVSDMKQIIESSQQTAHSAVNRVLLARNWLIGKRICDEEFKSAARSETYGVEIIKKLSKSLTEIYGKGYTKSNLYYCYSFYKMYPEIFQSLIGKSQDILTWTHYLALTRVPDSKARAWYHQEALTQGWSVRTLQRNIETQYYYRLLASQKKEPVIAEMKGKTAAYQNNKLEFIKNPMVVEFLGL